MLDAVKSIYREEGLLVPFASSVLTMIPQAFWKGNLAAELMVVPYGAVSFFTYHHTSNVLKVRYSARLLFTLVAQALHGSDATVVDLARYHLPRQCDLGIGMKYSDVRAPACLLSLS